jgi:hypothetical protein
MKQFHTIRDVSGFAVLFGLGAGGLWLCRMVLSNAFAFVLLFFPTIVALSVCVVGLLGVFWVLIERITFEIHDWRLRNKSHQ